MRPLACTLTNSPGSSFPASTPPSSWDSICIGDAHGSRTRRRNSWVGRQVQRTRANPASALQNGLERAAEARENVLPVQGPYVSHRCQGAVLAIHAGLTPPGVDDPYEPRARVQPVGHFGERFPGTVGG